MLEAKAHIGWCAASLTASLLLMVAGCDSTDREMEPTPDRSTLFNLEHLDHLGEKVSLGAADTARVIHIYSEAPDYDWVGDHDEGIACVDDAARAAVVYFRTFSLRGDRDALNKAEQLVRFILYMQKEDGLFYNFVWNNQLEINTSHTNSTADEFEWWASRAVWALGVAAEVLQDVNPVLSRSARDAIQRTLPHINRLLARYPKTMTVGGRTLPTWLVHETAADATSELLLGLLALQRAYPAADLAEIVDRLAEGIEMMQWGDMEAFPFAAHGSWREGWHGWGNSQTQALSEAERLDSAVEEARSFYSRLLVDGWMHSFQYDQPDSIRRYEQIAYAVRCVSVGLVRLYEASGDPDYLTMAGLAASWLTGNNVGHFEMYDPETGRGYDGIGSPTEMNTNAGAESTIEALFTILEIERFPESRRWLHAVGRETVAKAKDDKEYLQRTFVIEAGTPDADSVTVVMNLTDKELRLIRSDGMADTSAGNAN